MTQPLIDKLCEDFKIDEETFTMFEQFYNSKIEDKLKMRYLSHLVSTIEDVINDIFKEKHIMPLLKNPQYTDEQKRVFIRRNYRLYSIVLRPIKGFHKKGAVVHHNYGSLIAYNPDVMSESQIRILIAHELGHIINLYVLHCDNTQNRANVFSFVAINGKNHFYKNHAKSFTYPDERAIIEEINTVCPITKYKQVSK